MIARHGPGVWIAARVVPGTSSIRSPPCSVTSGAKVASCHSRWRAARPCTVAPVRALRATRRRRVVGVGVGGEDAGDRPGRGGEDRLDMRRRAPGPGSIAAHSFFVAAADQVGVGAGAGHDAAVVGGDADHPLREPHRRGRERCRTSRGRGRPGRCGRARHRPARRASPAAAPGCRRATCGIVSGTRRGSRAQAISAATSAKRETSSSVFCVGVSSFSVLLRASASAGRDPELLDHLGAVEQRHLRRRRGGDEEARVVALGPAERRQPVAEVDQRAGIEADALLRRTSRRCRARAGAARRARAPAGRRRSPSRRVVAVADSRGRTAGPIPRSDSRIAATKKSRPPLASAEPGAGLARRRCRSRRHGRSRSRGIDDAARETPRRRWCSRCRRRGARAAPRCRRRRRGRRRWSPPGRGGRSGAGCGGRRREGRSVGGGSAHRGRAGRRKERSSSVTRTGSRVAVRQQRPTAPPSTPRQRVAACCLSPPGRQRREDGSHRSGHPQRRRLRKPRSSTCFTMPSFSS